VTETFINNQSPESLICDGILHGNCPGAVSTAFSKVNLNNVQLEMSIVAGAPTIEIGGLQVPNGVRVYTVAEFTLPQPIENALNTMHLGFTNDSQIALGIQVPFTDPEGVSIFVRYDNILPNPNTSPPIFQFVFMSLSIEPAEVAVVIAGGFNLNFPANPGPLVFTAAISIAAGTGGGVSLSIQGAMAGTWYNAFGVNGLDVGDVYAEVGLTVPPDGIPVPSSVGAQGNITFGTTYLFFAMSVNPSARQFYAEVQTPVLSLAEIVRFILQTTNAPASTNIIVNILNLLEPIKVEDIDILIAPTSYTQPDTGVVIPQGFKIKGTIDFLLVDVSIDLELQKKTVSWFPAPINNFIASLGLRTGGLTSIFQNVNFVGTVMPGVINILNQHTSLSWGGWTQSCTSCSSIPWPGSGQICFPPDCPYVTGGASFSIDWTSLITSATSWLSSAWVVGSVSLTNVDIMGMIDRSNPVNPTLAFSVTLPGHSYSFSETVDINVFINQEAAAVAAFTSALTANAAQFYSGVLANFCTELQNTCHTFSLSPFPDAKVCFDASSLLGLC